MNDNTVKIIIAIIGLIGTVIGGLSSYLITSKKQAIQDAKREQNQSDKFDQIFKLFTSVEKRLDEHNHYAEKFADASKTIAIIGERQDYINKSIDKLQKDIDYLKSINK